MSSKTLLRRLLGVSLYRIVTQTPRYLRFLLKHKRDKEMVLLPSLIAPDDYCFDVGANYGQYAREIAPLLTTGKLFAFEPSRLNRAGLMATVKSLRLKNTVVIPDALSDAEGTQTLHVPVKSHGGLGIALAHLGTPTHAQTVTETVEVTTLDLFIRKHAIPRCDFIKCDAEGSEFNMLKGAVETVRTHRPIIQMEVATAYLQRNGASADDIGTFLNELGYRAFVCQQGRLAAVQGTVQNDRNNFFIPEEKLARFSHILVDAALPAQAA